MNIKYFQDTDTLYIEFSKGEIAETRDLDENTLLDVDSSGNIVALTMELHVPAPRINDIVRERRAITPDTALRLARYSTRPGNSGLTCKVPAT